MVILIEDAEIDGKVIFCRMDYNVPISNGKVVDDTRIKAGIPTLNYILKNNGAIIIISHLGRPKEADPSLSLAPIAKHLQTLMDQEVHFIPSLDFDVIQEEIKTIFADNGKIIVLENSRFHEGETKNDLSLAVKFANLADIFVSDAFGAVHRAHATTVGITNFIPGFAGYLVNNEYQQISQAMNNPLRPSLAIIGGAKISTKLRVIEKFLEMCNSIIIGGAMAFTFVKCQSGKVGNSLVEDSMLDTARKLLEIAKEKMVNFILPTDVRLAIDFDNPSYTNGKITVSNIDSIGNDLMGLDIGPESEKTFVDEINIAKTILWNGPMGVFENEEYRKGTAAIGKGILNSKSKCVIGGGDTIYALNLIYKGDIPKNIHVSTGGGASLELMSGGALPGLTCLNGVVNN